jgi:hypothetical protein
MMAGASPSATMRPIVDLFIAASRALYDAIWPALRHKMSNAVIRVREVYDGLLKTLWFGVHNVPTVKTIAEISGGVKVIIALL